MFIHSSGKYAMFKNYEICFNMIQKLINRNIKSKNIYVSMSYIVYNYSVLLA